MENNKPRTGYLRFPTGHVFYSEEVKMVEYSAYEQALARIVALEDAAKRYAPGEIEAAKAKAAVIRAELFSDAIVAERINKLTTALQAANIYITNYCDEVDGAIEILDVIDKALEETK